MDVLTSLTVAVLLSVLALGVFVIWGHFDTRKSIVELRNIVIGPVTEPEHATTAFRQPAPAGPVKSDVTPMSAFSFGHKDATAPEPAEIKPIPNLPAFSEKCPKCAYVLSVEARFCAQCADIEGIEHLHLLCRGCGHTRATRTRAA